MENFITVSIYSTLMTLYIPNLNTVCIIISEINKIAVKKLLK